MQTKLRSFGHYLFQSMVAAVFAALFLYGLIFFLRPDLSNLFPNNLSLAASAGSPANPTSSQTVEHLSEITVRAANNAIDIFKWAILAIIGGFGGIAGYLVNTLRRAEQRLLDTEKQINDVNQRAVESKRENARTQEVLNNLSTRYAEVLQELFDLTETLIPYELAADLFDKGKITIEKFTECQIWNSYFKMIYAIDPRQDAGYQELKYHKARRGIPVPVTRALFTELEKIRIQRKNRKMASVEDEKLRKMILDILGLQELPPERPAAENGPPAAGSFD